MSLTILVKRAVNLKNREPFGKSDPYATIYFQGESKKTLVKQSTLNPEWNEEFVYSLDNQAKLDELIYIAVKDKGTLGRSRLIGKTTIPIKNILQGKGPVELEENLLDGNDCPTTGTLYLSCTYETQQGLVRTESISSFEFSEKELTKIQNAPSESSIKSCCDNDSKTCRCKYCVVNTEKLAKPKIIYQNELQNMTINKVQIRIRVFKASQLLAGSNLKSRCIVKFMSERQQSKVIKNTQSPWYDQNFFFHYEGNLEDFMNEILIFRVTKCLPLIPDSIVGEFKCQIRKIYDQDDHAILNKWLVLVDPDEISPTIQGYLKVSAAIVVPGGEIPDFSINGKESDVEDNLMWAPGVYLQPAFFTLSIFLAEDLPRMDAGGMQEIKEALGFAKPSKNLVDPYVIVNFAGKEIHSRILYNNCDPEFRQEIFLGFLFPSMCDTLNIKLMDWDRMNNDDLIGSTTLCISYFSDSSEDGFPPTYGPSFINLYGPRREWELIEKSPNREGELCAYRGRILVSLKTTIGAYPQKTICVMDNYAFDSGKKFRSIKDFIIIAHFTHVSMLKDGNKPLEIEVSIGNFGNKLENSVMPSPSTTHPSNPIFDGCKYFYLPYTESEPFIVITCQWEDVAYRLEYANLLNNIIENIEKEVTHVKNAILHEETESSDVINTCLNNISFILKKAKTPDVDELTYKFTELDSSLLNLRLNCLNNFNSMIVSLNEKPWNEVQEFLETQISRLKTLLKEPQNSFPDIFLWLMSGTKRIAFCRVCTQDVLYAQDSQWKGKFCGKYRSFNFIYPETPTADLAGIVNGSLWFGKEEHYKEWWNIRTDLQLTVFAESYENQVIASPGSGTWKSKGTLLRRPAFSDADGFKELQKECFQCSDGWKFQGDWFVAPELSTQFENDAGHTVYCEEVYEQQSRIVGGEWVEANVPWTDDKNEKSLSYNEIECPDGWEWYGNWKIDLQRAVDAEGWEYTLPKGSDWVPLEKVYHIYRRRRWLRERHRYLQIVQDKSLKISSGWEYSSLFSHKFHRNERKIDIVRRRRWRRKLVPMDASKVNFPRITVLNKAKSVAAIACPKQYVISSDANQYQLRACIYQARNLLPGDKSGLSDPYCIVSFCGVSQQTEKRYQTLCPTWDQALIFDDLALNGNIYPPNVTIEPPDIHIEAFDWDIRGEPEFLGRMSIKPKIMRATKFVPSKLEWHSLNINNHIQGQILSSFDLILKDDIELPFLPPVKGNIYMVPFGVRPVLQTTRIEILCWGIRNMISFNRKPVSNPSVEFECAGKIISSQPTQNFRLNPNFPNPFLDMTVELPKDEEYMPPLIIRIYDNRAYGAKPMVASAQISNLFQMTQSVNIARNLCKKTISLPKIKGDTSNQSLTEGPYIDWWSKYYASLNINEVSSHYLEKGYETLEIINSNLENDPRFNLFNDMIETITLYRGDYENRIIAGDFKGKFCSYPVNEDNDPYYILAHHPPNNPQVFNVRVYVISAENLVPKDNRGTSDAYLKVTLGKHTYTSEKDEQHATLCPTFGKMCEFKANVPLHKDLKIEVWDKDKFSSDDFIGETLIDIENRILTKQRAVIGLPKQYHMDGINKWRDYQLPSKILKEICENLGTSEPIYDENTSSLILEGSIYSITDFESSDCLLPKSVGNAKERLSLYVLHNNFVMVPEYVEKRPLHNPEIPGISQGTITVWVDIFPETVQLPPAISITPRKPNKFELRVCIYHCKECVADEKNFAGQAMSDVYVKGWIVGTKNVQSTDIHYRCLDGESSFNWRFVFPFEYLESEHMVIISKKEGLLNFAKEVKIPPQLKLQIVDNDLFSADDYLGEITLDLLKMAKPARTPKQAYISMLPSQTDSNNQDVELINLFEKKHVSGFYPLIRYKRNGETSIGGKLKTEIQLLMIDEAKERPVGQGRSEPNQYPNLPKPDRPSESFFWLTSPLKSFKFVLWKNYKWYFITFIVLLILFLFVIVIVYSLSQAAFGYVVHGFD